MVQKYIYSTNLPTQKYIYSFFLAPQNYNYSEMEWEDGKNKFHWVGQKPHIGYLSLITATLLK